MVSGQHTCMQDATVKEHLQMDAMTGGTPKFRTGLNLKPWYLAGFRSLNRSAFRCSFAPYCYLLAHAALSAPYELYTIIIYHVFYTHAHSLPCRMCPVYVPALHAKGPVSQVGVRATLFHSPLVPWLLAPQYPTLTL